MKISVFGLGYVGCVTAACLARRGHMVIGVDVVADKVDLVNAGHSPVVEEGLSALLSTAVTSGLLRATTDAHEAVRESDLSLICVGTPSNENGSVRLEYIERVAADIGCALKHKSAYHLVVFRTTMLPGTLEYVLTPILLRTSGKPAGEAYGVVHHPEYLREGSAIRDFESPAKIVIGEWRRSDADLLVSLYDGYTATLVRTSVNVAAMAKYAENGQNAASIGYVNEIGTICKAFGVDSHEVMRIVGLGRHRHETDAYQRPGAPYGGSCLPKDLRALVHAARSHDLPIPLLEAIGQSNDQQKVRALRLIRDTGLKRVGVLGLSFKAGTDDLRESPAVELVERMVGKGYCVSIYDPTVVMSSLVGENKRYIERELPHLKTLLCENLQQVLDQAEVIVVTNHASEFAGVARLLRPQQVLIDLVRVPETALARGQYVGIAW